METHLMYIDPSAGSFIALALLGGLAMVGYWVNVASGHVRRILKRKDKHEDNDE